MVPCTPPVTSSSTTNHRSAVPPFTAVNVSIINQCFRHFTVFYHTAKTRSTSPLARGSLLPCTSSLVTRYTLVAPPCYALPRRETLKYKTVLHQHIIFYSKLILTFNCLLIFPSLSLSIFASQSCHFASTCHHEMSTCTRPPPSSHPSRCCKCLCRWQAITWSYCCRPFALGKHRTCVTTVVLPILLFQLCSLRLGSRHQITSISPGSNLPSSSPRNQQRSGCPT